MFKIGGMHFASFVGVFAFQYPSDDRGCNIQYWRAACERSPREVAQLDEGASRRDRPTLSRRKFFVQDALPLADDGAPSETRVFSVYV